MPNNWITNSAKTVGRSHLRESPPIPCQDSVLTAQENGVTIITLSDGCGSSLISEIGSVITTRVLCKFITANFDALYDLPDLDIKKRIIANVVAGIRTYIDEHPDTLTAFKKRDPNHHASIIHNWPGFNNIEKIYPITIFDATIQFVAEKNGRILLGRLGDGVIGAVKDDNVIIQSMEDKIGVEENATWYPSTIMIVLEKPSADPWEHFEIQKINNSTGYSMFFIVSDGLGDAIVGTDNDSKFIYAEDADHISKQRDLLSSLEQHYRPMKGIFDDLSVAVMKKENVAIRGIVLRKYNESGKTVSNNTVVTINLDEAEQEDTHLEATNSPDNHTSTLDSQSTDEFALPFDETYVDHLKKYIKNDDLKLETVIKATSKVYGFLKAKKQATFDEIAAVLKPDAEVIDVKMYASYWNKIKIFDVDSHKGIVKMR